MKINLLLIILLIFFNSEKSFSSQILNFADMKFLSQKTTAELVFDEAINIAPNFGINQIDSDLKAYFNPTTGKSELCVPTSLSHFLIYQMGITHALPIQTSVPGVSENLQTIDANTLIIDLTKRCKTDLSNGTNGLNLMNCIGEVANAYYGKDVTVDRIMKSSTDPQYPSYVQWQNRSPDINDITNALKNGEAILASIGWWKIDPITNVWSSNTGHEFMIYGYGWENYFQDNLLQLNILDPEFTWVTSTITSDFNNVMAIRRKDLSTSSIFLDGRGFNGQVSRAFLNSLTIIHFKQK